MTAEPIRIRNEKLGNKVVEMLKKKQFDAYYCEDRAAAKEKVMSLIPDGAQIAWGGSVTLQEIGVLDELRNGQYNILDMDTAKTKEERQPILRASLTSDVYLCSSNAVTEDGELFNIDGNGNRVAALIFGPKEVIVVCGMNKVVRDARAAEERARTIAAPTNAQKYANGTKACLADGKCHECYAPDCICTHFVRTRRCNVPGRIKVILVGENLGF